MHYARDAFEVLKLMDVIMSTKRGEARDVDSPEAVLGNPHRQGRRTCRLHRTARRARAVLGQWGLRGVKGGEGPSYEELVETEGRPRLRRWLDRLSTEGILAHAAVVYSYFPAVSEGDDVVMLTEPKPDAPQRFHFTFPRQQR